MTSTTMTPQLSSTSSEQPAEAPAASSSSSRPLINRPSNPIISMEEDESDDYKLIRLSQSSDDDDQIIESSSDNNKQNQQQQEELKQPSSSSSTTHKTTIDGPKVNFTASTKTGTGPSSDLNASHTLAKKGNGYLASQTDLTQTSPEKFAMGCTLLQLCAIGNLPTVINYITQTYPHVNFRDYDRRTALHVAASEGHLDVVKLLIARGAKINRSDRWGGSPLDDAHRHRHLVVARYLRSKGATTGSVNLTNNLISAAAAGDIEEVRLIVESNDNVVVVGMDMSGSQSSSKRGHGRSLSTGSGGGGGVVRMRTGSIGGISVKAPTLDLSGSRRLGKNGTSSNNSPGGGTGGVGGVSQTSTGGMTNNLDASSTKKATVVDINKGDYDHRTALHLAASEGHIDVVKFLCKRGANVNVEDRWGGRPLDDALEKDNKHVAEVLRGHGATSANSNVLKNNFRKSLRSVSKHSSGMESSDEEDENLRVDFSELEMIERIGSGAFGEIYKCRWRGILVAAKCIKASKIQKGWLLKKQVQSRDRLSERMEQIKQASITEEEKELALEDFRKETAIMRRLRHPNIVMMLAYSHTDDVEVMISEICRCSLLDIFRANAINNSHLPKRTQIIYAQQLAAGMNHLHKSRPPIIHRDLKPANLLVDFSGTLKIADFGLAKIRPNPEQNEVEAFQMTGETGSYRFMAPEVFRHEEYSETVDVYSYAMIFYYMLRSIPPWSGLSGVDAATKAAVDGERPLIPRDVDERISTLLKRCWDENPKGRPGFDEIITSLTIYSHDVFHTDTDNPDWEPHESKCMQGGCVIS
mmetsp:Transcript_15450/g.23381  ORF Transcript_15450/g.23381 Transcript_15450/m.23381 type:complete len:810 (-) Transcript_15450:630-3059(-)